MSTATILVVANDAVTRESLMARLTSEGYEVREAFTEYGALDHAANGIDLVLLDDRVPSGDGGWLLRRIEEVDPDILVILMSAGAGTDATRATLKVGAHDVARRPLDLDELARTVARAVETSGLRRALRRFRSEAALPYRLERIVGSSPAVVALRHVVARAAAGHGSPILLTGERGTGKNLVARIVHYVSDRAERPFVSISSSGLSGDQFERELSGCERGGTLFLNAIGELTPEHQNRLRHFLDQQRARAAGGGDRQADVRVIAATSCTADVFADINAVPISLPPLRSHVEDVPLLVEAFIETFNLELGKHVLGATVAAYTVLQAYAWPGNVRELRNLVERAMLLCGGDRLDARDFSTIASARAGEARFELPPGGVNLEEIERNLLVQALRRCGGNQTKAGSLLGMNRDQIRYRIEKFGLTAMP